MILDLLVAASLVFLTGGAFVYARWIDPPADFIRKHIVADDPWDEYSRLDRMDGLGQEERFER